MPIFGDSPSYYDQFNVPEVSGFPNSVYPDYNIEPIPQKDEDLLNYGGDLSEMDPNDPKNRADMSYLIEKMQGRFDDKGYYGLSQGQIEEARKAGLAALGANIAMGALSGTWQGFGQGNISGFMAERAARDEALKDFSNRNMANSKFIVESEKDKLLIEGAKQRLLDEQEERKFKEAGRKAALETWMAGKEQRNADIEAMSPEDRKIARRIEANVAGYLAAGNAEKAQEEAAKIDALGPNADKRAIHQAEVLGRANATANSVQQEAKNAEIQKSFDSTYSALGYELETDANGNLTLISPQVQQQRRDAHAASVALTDQRQETAAAKEAKRLREENDELFGYGNGGLMSPKILNKRIDESNKAVDRYNSYIKNRSTLDPNEEGITPEEVARRQKLKMQFDNDASTLTRNGVITEAEMLNPRLQKVIDNYNPLMVREGLIKRKNSYIAERAAQDAAAIGTVTPDMLKNVQVQKTLENIQDDKRIIPYLNSALSSYGGDISKLTLDGFLKYLDAAIQSPISSIIKSDPALLQQFKTTFGLNLEMMKKNLADQAKQTAVGVVTGPPKPRPGATQGYTGELRQSGAGF